MAKKRMAWETAHYLGVVAAPETEDIYLLGVGIKSLNRSPSPKTTTDAYINEKNGSPTITGYDNSFALNYDDIVDDDALSRRCSGWQTTSSRARDAEFYYYRVDLLAEAEAGAYPARRYRVACEPGDETNEAASVVTASCTLLQDRRPLKKYLSTRPPRRLLPIRRHDRRRRAMCSCAWRAACET